MLRDHGNDQGCKKAHLFSIGLALLLHSPLRILEERYPHHLTERRALLERSSDLLRNTRNKVGVEDMAHHLGDHARLEFGLTDGELLWPEGLVHYVEDHNVRLPRGIVERMIARLDDFDEAVGRADRVTVAVTLFAVLELYKQGELTWTQDEPFGEIEIAAPAPEPARELAS